jgi:phosphoglycerate dehydrogenase-like enzyme
MNTASTSGQTRSPARTGLIVLAPAVTRETVSNAGDLLAVGRFGVGYDAVDVNACTDANVVAFITAGAVDRPVAEAVAEWMIALTHNVKAKDRLVREGRWDDRSRYMGRELRDRTLGTIGLGGIARKLIELLAGWGMIPRIAFDPYVHEGQRGQVQLLIRRTDPT